MRFSSLMVLSTDLEAYWVFYRVERFGTVP